MLLKRGGRGLLPIIFDHGHSHPTFPGDTCTSHQVPDGVDILSLSADHEPSVRGFDIDLDDRAGFALDLVDMYFVRVFDESRYDPFHQLSHGPTFPPQQVFIIPQAAMLVPVEALICSTSGATMPPWLTFTRPFFVVLSSIGPAWSGAVTVASTPGSSSAILLRPTDCASFIGRTEAAC